LQKKAESIAKKESAKVESPEPTFEELLKSSNRQSAKKLLKQLEKKPESLKATQYALVKSDAKMATKTPEKTKTPKSSPPVYIPTEIGNIIKKMTKEVQNAEISEKVINWYNKKVKTIYNTRIKDKLSGYEKDEMYHYLIKQGDIFFNYFADQLVQGKYDFKKFRGKVYLSFSRFEGGFRVELFMMKKMTSDNSRRMRKELAVIAENENLKYTKVESSMAYIRFGTYFYNQKGVGEPDNFFYEIASFSY